MIDIVATTAHPRALIKIQSGPRCQLHPLVDIWSPIAPKYQDGDGRNANKRLQNLPHQEMTPKVACGRSLWQHRSTFLVGRWPLVAVVVITAAKAEVRRNIIQRDTWISGGGWERMFRLNKQSFISGDCILFSVGMQRWWTCSTLYICMLALLLWAC